MSIHRFGNVTPAQGEMLGLIGWSLSRGRSTLVSDESGRIEQMRKGHAELVRMTGQDFSYDLAKWRNFLLGRGDQFEYGHPFAFARVDQAVNEAISDPEFARLGALAKVGGEEWDQQYRAKLEAKHQRHMTRIAAEDSRITDNTCPFCGMPLPRYRFTCKHCDKEVRPRGE